MILLKNLNEVLNSLSLTRLGVCCVDNGREGLIVCFMHHFTATAKVYVPQVPLILKFLRLCCFYCQNFV
ncbi:hypothetical protein NQ317_005184 [Molorchus minor]|uniref:Uncharacterized protein n=1 Tax=Molorchus minor TaxID=1323400 RepID=A0ABQ9JEH7_9CUCU|nr:hypothetical protein NQ317_005184 [Molorchus minor]